MDDHLLCCLLCGTNTNQKWKQRLQSLPTAEPLRGRWISFIRLHFGDNWNPPGDKSVAVCSLHFEPSDFAIGSCCTHVLKSDSIPSIMVGKLAPTSEDEFAPKIFEEINVNKELLDLKPVDIATGTVHAFHSGLDVEIVHILVEKSTELQVNSLLTVEGVDNFINSDHKKFLPKMIKIYEASILRVSKQQQPLTSQDSLHLSRWIRELGVLKEKLFRWALEAIEEDFTISFDSDQQQTDFDKAEFLIYKATDRVHGKKLKEKDEHIKILNDNLQVMTNLLQEDKDIEKEKIQLIYDSGSGDKKGMLALSDSLREASVKEKKLLATVKQLRYIIAQNNTVIKDICRANTLLAKKESKLEQTAATNEETITTLCKNLADLDKKYKELGVKNFSLTKQLEEREGWLPAGADVMGKKRKLPIVDDEADLGPASEKREEQNELSFWWQEGNHDVQVIQVD